MAHENGQKYVTSAVLSKSYLEYLDLHLTGLFEKQCTGIFMRWAFILNSPLLIDPRTKVLCPV